jgi:hypothetical protein
MTLAAIVFPLPVRPAKSVLYPQAGAAFERRARDSRASRNVAGGLVDGKRNGKGQPGTLGHAHPLHPHRSKTQDLRLVIADSPAISG